MRLVYLLVVITSLVACGDLEPEAPSALLPVTEVGPSSDLSTPTVELTMTMRPGDSPATAVANPTDVFPTAQAETPTASAENDDEPVIIFQQEGGLMGMMQTWVIYDNGQVLTEENADCQVEIESISYVQTAAEESGFFDMSFSDAPAICCDFFTFTLMIRSGDMMNTVVVSEGDPKMPQELRELLTSVQQTVNSCNG
jgi:hypothetical protein